MRKMKWFVVALALTSFTTTNLYAGCGKGGGLFSKIFGGKGAGSACSANSASYGGQAEYGYTQTYPTYTTTYGASNCSNGVCYPSSATVPTTAAPVPYTVPTFVPQVPTAPAPVVPKTSQVEEKPEVQLAKKKADLDTVVPKELTEDKPAPKLVPQAIPKAPTLVSYSDMNKDDIPSTALVAYGDNTNYSE